MTAKVTGKQVSFLIYKKIQEKQQMFEMHYLNHFWVLFSIQTQNVYSFVFNMDCDLNPIFAKLMPASHWNTNVLSPFYNLYYVHFHNIFICFIPTPGLSQWIYVIGRKGKLHIHCLLSFLRLRFPESSCGKPRCGAQIFDSRVDFPVPVQNHGWFFFSYHSQSP